MRYPKHPEPTAICVCWSCGDPRPMGCGDICADCSWEDHLEHMAHIGERTETTHPATPTCCNHSHEQFEIALEHYINHNAAAELR